MSAVNTFDNSRGAEGAGLESPAIHAFTVTPDDANDLSFVTRALYVGAAGDVVVVMIGGETVTFAGVAAGMILPVRVSRVLATGTSASSIIGVY